MSRTITVRVVDDKGYGLYGYRVKAYGGNEVKTNSDGKALIEVDGNQVSIYVNGVTAYSGSVSNCDNPLVVIR